MYSLPNRIIDTSVKPLIIGGTGALASKLFLESAYIPIYGYNVDLALFYGLVIGGASALNAMNENIIQPMLPNGAIKAVGRGIQPLFTGLATLALLEGVALYNGSSLSMSSATKGFLLGAGSEVTGQYIKRSIDPLIQIGSQQKTIKQIENPAAIKPVSFGNLSYATLNDTSLYAPMDHSGGGTYSSGRGTISEPLFAGF